MQVRSIEMMWDCKSISIFSELLKEDQNFWVFINFEIAREVFYDTVVIVVMLILCFLASIFHRDSNRYYVLKSLACN